MEERKEDKRSSGVTKTGTKGKVLRAKAFKADFSETVRIGREEADPTDMIQILL